MTDSNLIYQGLLVEFHAATGFVCLTDLWQAQCAPTRQRPLAWVRLEATQKLLKRLARQVQIEPLYSEHQRPGQEPEQLIVALPDYLETMEVDGNLRTYATTELAVVYARYLSPECYEWALANLAEGDLAEQWARQQTRIDTQTERKAMTRRAVIAAGWTIPVVTTLGLSRRAAAQVSPGHHDRAGHNDTGHNDGAYVDHGDAANHIDHNDTAHFDHNDVTNHSDHNDTPHNDAAHNDHNDVPHNDVPHDDHNDVPHDDHNDVPHDDHNDIPHFDHNDIPHFDFPPPHTDTVSCGSPTHLDAGNICP